MELNNFDTTIRDTIQRVSYKEGKYCSWSLAMINRENELLYNVKNSFPALLQIMEDKKSPSMNNGNVERTVEFYLCNPRTEDILKNRLMQDILDGLVLEFISKLNNTLRAVQIGEREYLNDQLTVKEVGVRFKLKIEDET